MDRYFIAKAKENITLTYPDLHLIGVVCIFIASKYEDVEAISMTSLLEEVGHGKFSKLQILKMEREILRSLSFKVHTDTLFTKCTEKLNTYLTSEEA